MREIVLDTETTGLFHWKGDRIVEIGCVELINRIPTGEQFHSYFNPQTRMHPVASKITGIKDRMLVKQPLFHTKIKELEDFIGDSTIVIHNRKFDMGFLKRELIIAKEEYGVISSLDPRVVCTLALSRKVLPELRSHKLDALCTYFSIDIRGRKKHGAIKDCLLTASVYKNLGPSSPRKYGLQRAINQQSENDAINLEINRLIDALDDNTDDYIDDTEDELDGEAVVIRFLFILSVITVILLVVGALG